ncbi:MAG: DNA double-strand break repair nuclease NurA, partial [Chloroflexota bacterium]
HISRQIAQLSQDVAGDDYREQLALARELLRAIEPDQMRAKHRARRQQGEKIPWPEAYVPFTLAQSFPAPLPPRNFGVAAADGSDIPPDRHSPVHFSVINTGRVYLQYGDAPRAEMMTEAQFLCAEDLWLMSDDDDEYLEKAIEGPLLAAKRAVEELCALWETCQGRDVPLVALDDGQLILWPIQKEPRAIRDQLVQPFVATLEKFRQARIPVASYISYTNAKDIVYALRSFICQDSPIRCEVCKCLPDLRLRSLALKDVRDRHLFADWADGARTDVFVPESVILKDYGSHAIEFFYVNVGGEIARVEAPQWVTRDAALLDFVHAVVVDQCRRSPAYPPYPPVLQEAHEQAVIPTNDRRVIEQMVEEALQQQGMVYMRGAKDRSKRVRTV